MKHPTRACLILMEAKDNRRNRLEAAVDQLHIKMGTNVVRSGRQFTKAIKAKKQLTNK